MDTPIALDRSRLDAALKADYRTEIAGWTLSRATAISDDGRTIAGNPVLSNPNGRRLERALKGLEFMASIDFYVNETTQHADIVLPPVTMLEGDHYPLLEHAMAVRNTARVARAMA